jgi:hypothetical protein
MRMYLTRIFAVLRRKMVWEAHRPVSYRILGKIGQSENDTELVFEFEFDPGWFGGRLLSAEHPPLSMLVDQEAQMKRTPGSWWAGLLPRGIRRFDSVTLLFELAGEEHTLFVTDFKRLKERLKD